MARKKGRRVSELLPAPVIDLAKYRPMTGPADWPAVRLCCRHGRWQAAYGAAWGDPNAAAFIEARKAEELAALTTAWRERRNANGNP